MPRPDHNIHKRHVILMEPEKTIDICDQFGKKRYKVILACNTQWQKPIYTISVFNVLIPDDPLVAQYPNEDEDIIVEHYKAMQIFNDCVKQYSSLVEAEQRGMQNIHIAAEQIDYKVQKIKCCATCKYARIKGCKHDFVIGVSNKLECINPDTQINKNFAYHEPFDHRDRRFHDHSCRHIEMLHPKVDAFGICMYYTENNLPEDKIVPGDKISDVIDSKISRKMHNLTGDIDEKISTQLSTVIDNIQIEQIIGMQPDTNLNGLPDDLEDLMIGGGEV